MWRQSTRRSERLRILPAVTSTLYDVPTPAVLVCARRLERNLERMAAKAARERVELRPHAKTHRSIALASKQRSHGAAGLTVAKVGEAEVFAAAGFDDLRVAYPLVQRQQFERLIRLQEAGTKVSFLADSREGVEQAKNVFRECGAKGRVLIKVDCGYGRVGIPWHDPGLEDLARLIDDAESLELVGVLTHAGQSYDGPSAPDESKAEALARYAELERDRALEAASRLAAQRRSRGLGLPPLEVSIGSTPTLSAFRNASHPSGLTVTEVRPGNYVFNDMTQVALGAATLEQCALTVLATVASVQEDEQGRRHVVDAGRKVLTSDLRFGADGYGQLLEGLDGRRPIEGARLPKIAEEHLQVRSPSTSFTVGDRLRIVPNHACVVVSTQSQLWLETEAGALEAIAVDARGRST